MKLQLTVFITLGDPLYVACRELVRTKEAEERVLYALIDRAQDMLGSFSWTEKQ